MSQQQELQEKPVIVEQPYSDHYLTEKGESNDVEYQSSDHAAITEEGEYGPIPTEEEMKSLTHVGETIPFRCWLVAIVELAERFAYYGLSTPFQNYMQNGPDDSPKGVLMLDQQGATGLSYFFQFWCYITPIFGAWVADTYFGKLKTIIIFAFIYSAGIFILFITSFDFVSRGGAIAGFVIAIIIIGIGTGGIKANVSPLIADQVPKINPYVKTLKNGQRVVSDPTITIQNVFMVFYLMINVGSLSVVATTELEKNVDFWAAYLLPFCFFFIAIAALLLGRKVYVKLPVGDKVIAKTFRIAFIGIKNKFDMTSAKPSVSPEMDYPWTDKFVDEISRAVKACKVFTFYPVYWVVYGQMINNFISQAATMELHGFPNDIFQVFDSIAIIVFVPIFEKFLYPFIRRFTPFKAITKITWGFFFGSAAMVYAAVLQHYIYIAGPCYDSPLDCPGYKNVPNHVNVGIQTPAYVLIGISEILASVTGLEYAYTKAPVTMKSFITSIYLLTNAFGSAIGIALSSVSVDPKLVYTYSGLGISSFIAGCLVWICFHHYNAAEDELNKLDYVDDNFNPVLTTDMLTPVASSQPLRPISSKLSGRELV